MAIITPLKKIFNWQTASEKIPYKVYKAYITVDDNNNLYASQVFENTIGNVTFNTGAGNYYQIILPYLVPRLKIVIPGFGDFWSTNNGLLNSNPLNDTRFTIYPGFGLNDSTVCADNTCSTNCVGIYIPTGGPVPTSGWRTFFNAAPTGLCTSYPIEIQVYN